MRISNLSQFRAAMRQGKYAWPGGYECFFVTSDGVAICFDCARKERRSIIDSVANRINDGWRAIAFECSANCDGPIDCDHCGAEIIEGQESSQ